MGDFYTRLLAQLGPVTKKEKEAIRRELSDHVADHAAALEEAGVDPEEAEQEALEAMGDPEEIGKALARQYSLPWLVISSLAEVGAVLLGLALFLLVFLNRLGMLTDNLTARFAPEQSGFGTRQTEGTITRKLDLKVELGDDVLSVYKLTLAPQVGEAELSVCNYDQNPFGFASDILIINVTVVSQAGYERNVGGGGSAGAYFYTFSHIPVQAGEQYIYLQYDRFGDRVTLEIPLEWGEEP